MYNLFQILHSLFTSWKVVLIFWCVSSSKLSKSSKDFPLVGIGGSTVMITVPWIKMLEFFFHGKNFNISNLIIMMRLNSPWSKHFFLWSKNEYWLNTTGSIGNCEFIAKWKAPFLNGCICPSENRLPSG